GDGVGGWLWNGGFVSFGGGGGSWRLLFALCVWLLILACWLLRFLSWLSRRLLRLSRRPRLRHGLWLGSARRCHRGMFRLGGRRLGFRRGGLGRRLIVGRLRLILALNSEPIAYEATDVAHVQELTGEAERVDDVVITSTGKCQQLGFQVR